MAAADYPGGLRPHPPARRPGPRPSSRCPGRSGRVRRRAGISSSAT